MTPKKVQGELFLALAFAAKLLACLGVIVLGLWTIKVAIDFSKWTGLLAISMVVVLLLATAHRWIRWLPGILVFGVVNSLIVLTTHRVPTGPVSVSTASASLMLVFFALGAAVSYCYGEERITPVDRCAFVIYCGSPVWAALTPDGLRSASVVTGPILYPLIVGMAVILVAFTIRLVRRRGSSQAGGPRLRTKPLPRADRS
jgi:hypothetical protein